MIKPCSLEVKFYILQFIYNILNTHFKQDAIWRSTSSLSLVSQETLCLWKVFHMGNQTASQINIYVSYQERGPDGQAKAQARAQQCTLCTSGTWMDLLTTFWLNFVKKKKSCLETKHVRRKGLALLFYWFKAVKNLVLKNGIEDV